MRRLGLPTLPFRHTIALVAMMFLSALPAAAQTVVGRVLDGDLLAPAGGATIVALDSTLVVVARATADSAGEFAIRGLPPGDYVFQAQIGGRSGALTAPVTLAPDMAPLTLVLPSELFALGLYCPVGPRLTALVGVVYERRGEVVLPGARVAIHWPGRTDSLVATTDPAGRYRFCGVPVRTTVDVHLAALGRQQSLAVDVPPGRVARADLPLDLGAGGSSLQIRTTTVLSRDDGLGILAGRILDVRSGAPVEQVIVRLRGREEPAYTGPGGDFRFIGVGAGDHVLEIEHLAYGTQREVVSLPPATAMDVDIRVAQQAITLARIEARGDAELQRAWRASATRFDVVAGRELAIEERRGARIADVVKTRFPSLKVSEGWFSSPQGSGRGVCMESIRRIMSLRADLADGPPSGEGGGYYCHTIEVILDDIPVTDPISFLGTATIADFESVSFMSAVDAATRFGLGSGGGGVLVLYTRGRGPYVSQERNVPPE